MKYFLLCIASSVILFTSCSNPFIQKEVPENSPHINSWVTEMIEGSGFIKTSYGYTSSGLSDEMYSQIWEINIKKWENGQYRESSSGYIIYNPASCIYEWPKGIYDWIDYDASWSKIIEAGCFTSDINNNTQYNYWYQEDENGTYYQDKDGWAYNLRRISKYNWWSLENDLVTTTASWWVIDRFPLYWVHDEVYMYGNILTWVTDPHYIKILNFKDDGLPTITDGKNIWHYKYIFEWADPTTFTYLTRWVYIDKKSCYIASYMEIIRLQECNPNRINLSASIITDGRYSYDYNGNILH